MQYRAGCYWTETEVHERLRTTMVTAFDAIYERMMASGADMRSAAYAQALSRLGNAMEAQGTYRYYAHP